MHDEGDYPSRYGLTLLLAAVLLAQPSRVSITVWTTFLESRLTVVFSVCSIVSRSISRQVIAMDSDRLFHSLEFMKPSDDEPIRSVITESAEAVVVAWYVKPGQRIAAHLHPAGQDTWTILSGQGDYQTDPSGSSLAITAGDVLIAPKGCLHGVLNRGQEPLTFISVVSPSNAGYEPLQL
jgi:quercetin dioxygenase-like cupin family protein